jgi:hypothetical protein
MQGGIIPFVASCFFLGFGLLAVQGVVGTLWRSRRFRGRAEGTLVALETVDGRRYTKAVDVPTGPTAPLSFRQVVRFSLAGTAYEARGPFMMREFTRETSYADGHGTVTTSVAPLEFEPGATVTVAYNPGDPRDATLRGTGQTVYLVEAFSIQTFIGIICIAVGLGIFFFNGNLAWLGADWHP